MEIIHQKAGLRKCLTRNILLNELAILRHFFFKIINIFVSRFVFENLIYRYINKANIIKNT